VCVLTKEKKKLNDETLKQEELLLLASFCGEQKKAKEHLRNPMENNHLIEVSNLGHMSPVVFIHMLQILFHWQILGTSQFF
jgi:hypothetical protein